MYKMWSVDNAIVTALGTALIVACLYVFAVFIASAMTFTFAWQLNPFCRGLLAVFYILIYIAMFPQKTQRMR